MPRFCKTCGVDAPNAGDVAGVRHVFIEGNYSTHFNDFIIFYFDEIFIFASVRVWRPKKGIETQISFLFICFDNE